MSTKRTHIVIRQKLVAEIDAVVPPNGVKELRHEYEQRLGRVSARCH